VSDPLVIGVDVGGTKLLSGVVDSGGQIEGLRESPTDVSSQDALLRSIVAVVEELLDDGVVAVGFGLPARIDRQTGRPLRSVNIPLDEIDFAEYMRGRFGFPVGLENDANAAAYAEWLFGAGRGSTSMVMLTLGTGVGGGVIIDGQLFRGWAELGHVVVEHDGPPCQGRCTGRGHLEAFVSGTAADRAASAAFGPAADARHLTQIAREGDQRAREILAGMGRMLGSGIGSFVNIFNPDVVVIGGGFANAGELIFDSAREVAAREALWPAGEHVQIVPGELGEVAGLVGAALVGFEAAGFDIARPGAAMRNGGSSDD
jgi:glucokinase